MQALEQAGENWRREFPFGNGTRRRLLLFFVGQFPFLADARCADEHDAQQRDDHARQGDLARFALQQLSELMIEQGRSERSDRGTEAAADSQSESDAEVTDHESPGQAAESPHGAAQEAVPQFLDRSRRKHGRHVGRRGKRQRPRHDQQSDDGVNQPVAFPGPAPDLFERQIEHGPGQTAEDEYQHARQRFVPHDIDVSQRAHKGISTTDRRYRRDRTSRSYCLTTSNQAIPTGTFRLRQ